MTNPNDPAQKPGYPNVPVSPGPYRAEPPPWADLTRNPVHASLHAQHGWPAEPQAPKKVWIWVMIAVLVTVIVACALVGGALWGEAEPKDTVPTTASKAAGVSGGAAAEQAGPDKSAKVGDTVRAGDGQYQVHAVKCGLAKVGNQYLSRKAQGSFCRVDLTVTNVGRDSMLFHADSSVKAEDTKGRKFSPDGEAGIYGNENGAGFLSEINPGNHVRAFVFFDLPQGAKLKEIEVSSGFLGDDVEIQV